MIRKLSHISIAFIGIYMLSSCATIFNGGSPLVVIEGDVDEPVTITTPVQTYTDVNLPLEVKLKRHGIEGQHIQITSNNHEFDDVVVEKKTKYWTLLNVYNYGPGCLVDWLSNSNVSPRHTHYLVYPDGKGETVKSSEPFHTNVEVYRPHAKDFYRHELSVSWALGNQPVEDHYYDIIDNNVKSYDFVLGSIFDDSGVGYYNGMNLDYTYNVNRRLGVGLSFGIGAMTESYSKTEYFNPEPNLYVAEYYYTNTECSSIYIMPSVRYKWWISRNNRFAAYSSVALGYAHSSYEVDRSGNMPAYSESKNALGYHVTLAGLEIGRGHLRSFLDIGTGYKGFFSAGLKYCF